MLITGRERIFLEWVRGLFVSYYGENMTSLQTIREQFMPQIMAEPFVKAIGSNSLTQRQADYYTAQDASYIEAFMPIVNQIDESLHLTRPTSDDEGQAHLSLVDAVAPKPLDLVGQSYVNHMRSAAQKGAMAAIMATLPCVESYYFIAKALAHQTNNGWQQYYASKQYHDLVTYYWQIVDHSDSQLDVAIFEKSYQFELKFWRNAYEKGSQY